MGFKELTLGDKEYIRNIWEEEVITDLVKIYGEEGVNDSLVNWDTLPGAGIEVIQIGTTCGKSTTEMLETLDFNYRNDSIIDAKKRNKSLHKSEKSFFRGISYKGKKR